MYPRRVRSPHWGAGASSHDVHDCVSLCPFSSRLQLSRAAEWVPCSWDAHESENSAQDALCARHAADRAANADAETGNPRRDFTDQRPRLEEVLLRAARHRDEEIKATTSSANV
jgi:hypothetical protein